MRHRILLAASFLYLAEANLIWIALDTRPPFWDMATHQSEALRVYDAVATHGVIGALRLIPILTGYYPPLYQSLVALFYAVFGKTVDAAQWTNLPAIAVLFIATYGLGRTLLSPMAAASAAVMVNFYPLLLWLSRETLMDYWLTAIVALAMWLLVRTGEFKDWPYSIAFGAVCGLGMLTKWTFAFFIALPFLWLARKNMKNAAMSAGIAAVIAAYWYLSSITALLQFAALNTAGGIAEGDPNRLSLQALIFYLRALAGYQVFLPLFIAFVAGAILLARRFDRAWMPVVLWIASGWLVLMLFQNKDPRYTAPLLPAVALVTAKVFERKEALIAALIPFLVFQHYLVSFGVRQLPEKIVLMEGMRGPLSWDWNLYTQTYFDLWGPPAREDWQIERVLEKITPQDARLVRLGMVPDIPRFDASAFEFYVTLENRPVIINRLWTFDEASIARNDFILVSERGNGFAESFTHYPQQINPYIFGHPDFFRVVEWFPLPNGEVIRLYKVGSS